MPRTLRADAQHSKTAHGRFAVRSGGTTTARTITVQRPAPRAATDLNTPENQGSSRAWHTSPDCDRPGPIGGVDGARKVTLVFGRPRDERDVVAR